MIKKAVKHFMFKAEKKAEKAYKIKTIVAENLAITRKRKLYKTIKWTKEQKNSFNSFSKKIYGKKIPSYWHKLYQSINGEFNVSYIPEKFMTTVIELNANEYKRCSVLEDKNILSTLLPAYIKTPETIVYNSNGFFYNTTKTILSYNDAINEAFNCGQSIIKPTVGTSSGKNVRFLNIINGVDTFSQTSIDKLFSLYGKNFTLQKRLSQCKEVNDIYPNSINTFRITTYVLNGKIYSTPCALRFGSGGGTLDNIHAGGYGVAVSDEGVLGKYAFKLGRCDCKGKIEKHPDTGIIFNGYRIPCFQKILNTAKIAHAYFIGVGFISWDIIIDTDYEPTIIEANLIGQGYWFPQVLHGKGLFGDKTKEVIDYYFRK